jgi:hypothetical protein
MILKINHVLNKQIINSTYCLTSINLHILVITRSHSLQKLSSPIGNDIDLLQTILPLN